MYFGLLLKELLSYTKDNNINFEHFCIIVAETGESGLFNKITLKNFGPLGEVVWQDLGMINLVIGENGCGKTFILKALYSAIRTLEEYKRGNDKRSESEILADKLYWTFQPDKIGDLVKKGAESALSCTVEINHQTFSYSFGKDTSKKISSLNNQVPPRSSNSIFIPAKEILSLHQIILKSRDTDKAFGFDDTCLDLARALIQLPSRGKTHTTFAVSHKKLETLLGGKVEYEKTNNQWQYKKGNQTFPIGVTAEGIKKIAILDTLLGNRYLNPQSILFIDEPESSLHPVAINQLLDIIADLAQSGIQIFLASHSYFVVKKLYLIAQKKGMSIPVMKADNNQWITEDLKDGIPDNAIIDESIRLYKEEVELVLK